MKFTTPCFVRVEDAEKRKELIEWLVLIGYVDKTNMSHRETIRWFADDSTDQEILATGIFILAIQSSENMETRKMIDCGSNIELFKALAAMNDENDLQQWFVKDCGCYGLGWILCRAEKIYNHFGDEFDCIGRANWAWEDYRQYRKATAAEIVEHFKNKRK